MIRGTLRLEFMANVWRVQFGIPFQAPLRVLLVYGGVIPLFYKFPQA